MTDHTKTDSHSEIAALEHEVYCLTKQLNEQEQRHLTEAMPDKYDPFDNPTEYKGFCGDYSKIQPRITETGYELPLEPDFSERKKLRREYSKGGWLMLFQFLLSNGLGYLLIQLAVFAMSTVNPDSDTAAISEYIRGSSILVSTNMLVYLFCNVCIALIGMKWSGIRYTSLVRTNDFSIGRALQYCMIGLLLWTVSLYLVTGTSDVFSKYGIDIIPDLSGVANTYLGKTVQLVYSCMIAPVTEELFFRGVLLRTFAKSNQRFAVFISALFFGLVHGNLQQFILAFLLGIFLAHITLKHGSIIPSILVHICVNTASTIIGYVAELGTVASILSYLALLAVALLGVIMLLMFIGKDKLPSTTPKQARRGILVATGSIPFMAAILIYSISIFWTLFAKR
ncbi:MAG: CPBP family intramembrane metalloprotease [Ruminococcus sp.]|nr:CPBP family intramembrane metalloprotease [Ruminococcus sp.]